MMCRLPLVVAMLALSTATTASAVALPEEGTADDLFAASELRGLVPRLGMDFRASAFEPGRYASAAGVPSLDLSGLPALDKSTLVYGPLAQPRSVASFPIQFAFLLLPDGSLLTSMEGDVRAGAMNTPGILAPGAAIGGATPASGAGPASAPQQAPLATLAGPVARAPASASPGGEARAASAEVPTTPSGDGPGALVVAGSVAAAGLLGLLGFALYHRIRPAATLENDTRKSIFDAVCARPGLGVHDIADAANVSYSTATYHLERLVAAGMLVMTPDGNKLCYYKNGGAFTENERRLVPILKNEEATRLLEAILEEPGTYRAALANRLGVTATTINWHLRRLREAGLIDERREGRNAYLYGRVTDLATTLRTLATKLGAEAEPAVTRLCAAASIELPEPEAVAPTPRHDGPSAA